MPLLQQDTNDLITVIFLVKRIDNQSLALFKLQDKQALSYSICIQKHVFHYFSS